MTSPLALPQARIPLGWAVVNGDRTPVLIDIEWMRALLGLLNRTGGVSGPGDLAAAIEALQVGEMQLQPCQLTQPILSDVMQPSLQGDAGLSIETMQTCQIDGVSMEATWQT